MCSMKTKQDFANVAGRDCLQKNIHLVYQAICSWCADNDCGDIACVVFSVRCSR